MYLESWDLVLLRTVIRHRVIDDAGCATSRQVCGPLCDNVSFFRKPLLSVDINTHWSRSATRTTPCPSIRLRPSSHVVFVSGIRT